MTLRLLKIWSLLIILYLGSADCLIFNKWLKNIAGISQRMLTVTLRLLEQDGIVARQEHAEVPPRGESCLTEVGQSPLGAVIDLGNWTKTHAPAIVRARQQAALANVESIR
ncbi:winged helix-turn-helix transcriptional regulator [Hymenobacter coccineus]|uniref:winged helix-turn-helix transcriptional regulator n=1 Tax=Hymenobacter coccineus TaxID=1908235 RepID=UPI0013018E22